MNGGVPPMYNGIAGSLIATRRTNAIDAAHRLIAPAAACKIIGDCHKITWSG